MDFRGVVERLGDLTGDADRVRGKSVGEVPPAKGSQAREQPALVQRDGSCAIAELRAVAGIKSLRVARVMPTSGWAYGSVRPPRWARFMHAVQFTPTP